MLRDTRDFPVLFLMNCLHQQAGVCTILPHEHVWEKQSRQHSNTPLCLPQNAVSHHNTSYWKGRQYIGVGPGELLSTLKAVIDENCTCCGNMFVCDRGTRAVCSCRGGRCRSGGQDPDSGAWRVDPWGPAEGTWDTEADSTQPSWTVRCSTYRQQCLIMSLIGYYYTWGKLPCPCEM